MVGGRWTVPSVRVLVDGRALTDSSSYRGIGTYLRNLLPALAAQPGLEVAVLLPEVTAVPARCSAIPVTRRAPGRSANLEHDVRLPLELLRHRADVVLAPGLDPPYYSPTPVVQIVHDVLPLMGGGGTARRWRRRAWRYRRAAVLVAVSDWTARSAIQALALDPARVHVVPPGVPSRYRPAAVSVETPYLLFVGEYDPRKRHALAFAAIAALAERGFPHVLQVTGRIAPWYAETMRGLHAQAPRPDRVELLGHVPEARLLELYQGATALLVTSEGEGFGLPALEAMACGTPVVAFNNSATTELVSGAGILVPDGDLAALVDAVESLVRSPALSAELSNAALARASLFSWDRTAGRLGGLLRSSAS